MINNLLNNTYLVLLILFLLLITSVPFQKTIDLKRNKFRSVEQTLYLNSSTLKKVSLGFKELFADIYWFRAIQYFGSDEIRLSDKNPKLLLKYFNIITDLDPKFVNAYRYGGTFLAEPPPFGLNDLNRGAELLDKGRKNNPDNFRIPLEQAFLFYLYSNNHERAAELFKDAASKPGLSDFRKNSLKGMAASSKLKSGDRELSKKIWEEIFYTSENQGRKNFALQNLKELNTMDIEDKLTKIVKQFKLKYGKFPNSLDELVKVKYLKKIPRDHQDNNYLLSTNSGLVKSSTLINKYFRENLGFINIRAKKFKSEFNRYPRNIEELRNYLNFTSFSRGFPEHPLGEEYLYNPETGEVTYDEWW